MNWDQLLRDSIKGMEVICLFFAIKNYGYFKDTPNRYLLHLLVFIIFVEAFALLPVLNYFYPENILINSIPEDVPGWVYLENQWLYNIYGLVFSCFFIWYFKKFTLHSGFRKVQHLLFYSVIVISLYGFTRVEDFFNYQFPINLNLITQTIGILIAVLLYLYSLILNDSMNASINRMPMIVAVGLLLNKSLFSVLQILLGTYDKLMDVYVIGLFLWNLFLYGSLTLAFIVAKKSPQKNMHAAESA
ncbi:hypothetical protein [Robertkochia aurantiaca]|uniref:hypothetical protein n=1 Tax=Robertkochia aurantiaca TaxID=2873700 RepID=UPI001CCDBDC9|nr:hypothetical protein [Robertkochia sp. 3YJGBD-33]